MNKIFLIDGLGAAVSAVFLGIVLVQFQELFGMPKNVLYLLTGIAVVFAIHSIRCYFMRERNKRALLRNIAIGNLLYCVLTIVLLVHYQEILTRWGWAYFVGELLVIIILSAIEINYVKTKKQLS